MEKPTEKAHEVATPVAEQSQAPVASLPTWVYVGEAQRIGFRNFGIFAVFPKTSEVIGYLFDSQRCIAEGRGRRQGNKEIIEWKWSATGQGATSVRIIERINDNEFTLSQQYTLPDGSKMEDKVEMTRKK